MSWIDELTKGSSVASKIGFRGELEFYGASEGDQSGRTVTFRIVRAPEDMVLANPFSQFTRRRGKRAGSIFEAVIAGVASGEVVYSDELMLAGWADGPQGASVKFWLAVGGDRHPFLGYTRPSAAAAGSRFMAVLLEKREDEQIVDQIQVTRVEALQQPRSKQLLSNAVAMIVKQQRFLDWLAETVPGGSTWNIKLADAWVKGALGIESKAQLDDGKHPEAVAGWTEIRRRYVAWRNEQGDFHGDADA